MITFTTMTQAVEAFKPSIDHELVQELITKQIRIIAIRHGEALHNLGSLMNSSRSPGIHLTERGIQQVRNAAEKLRHEQIHYVYASPVYRTMQTAHYLTTSLGVPHLKVAVAEDLREQHFGIFEGRSYYEYVDFFDDPEDVYTKAAPEGESGEELYIRTKEFLRKVASAHEKETVVLVTHAFNCHHINYCLTGSDADLPNQAEFKIYSVQGE
ncbi:MAG: histidine phosphatase family protein [Parachlamydiales bacterium]